MKRFPLFWKIYVVVLATLFLSVFGIRWLDQWFERAAILRAESEFEARKERLEVITRELAEELEQLADLYPLEGFYDAVLLWVRQKELDSGLDIFVSLDHVTPTGAAGYFSITVNEAAVRIAPPLVAIVTSVSGRTTVFSRQEPFRDWDELRTPLPHRLFFLMIIVGAAASYLLLRNFMTPLRALGKATSQMALGDFSVRIDESAASGQDELRKLGAAFNVMAAQVEKSLKTQKRLLADISHELRAPLQRLSLAFTLIENDIKDRQADDFALSQAKHDIRHMDYIIGELLGLARFEATEEPNLERVSLKTLLTSIVQSENFEWGHEGQRVEFCGEDVTVNGDPKLLGRAMRNVINNAARYSPAGSKVEVSLTSEGCEAVVRVRDHGDGVAEEDLENIFAPFYRAESAQTRTISGSGLGLAIVKRVMTGHGGTCTAENARDGGLLMTLRLPL